MMQPNVVVQHPVYRVTISVDHKPRSQAMQPSTHNLDCSPDNPRCQHDVIQSRLSFFRVVSAIEQGEQRPPTIAEFLNALEHHLHAAQRQETLRRFFRVLARLCSLLVLDGDESPRE
jgi:hypothetical protein